MPEPHLVGLVAGVVVQAIASWKLSGPAWLRHGVG